MHVFLTRSLALAAFACTLAGCGSGTAPDSLSSLHGAVRGPALGCTEKCHNGSDPVSPDPVATNGSGTAGKHVRHVQERGIACERCHSGYAGAPTHMNGTLDTRNPSANLIRMDITGPKSSWSAGTGQCANISCHGSDTLDWYGTTTWTTPADCIVCHTSAYAAVLDPLATNGSGTAGKHGKHVSSYAMACGKCHWNYPSRESHASGVLDTADPSVVIVWFDAVNTAGTWTKDAGPGTGVCSSLACHGLYSGTFTFDFAGDGNITTVTYTGAGVTEPSWYNAGLGCSACHGNPPPAYPAWHGSHANNSFAGANDCQLCHPDATGSSGVGTAITNTLLHVNGTPNVSPQWRTMCFNCHQ